MLIPEDLELDMMGVCHVFFDQQTLIAKGVESFAPRRLDRVVQLAFRVDGAHPFPASTGRGFDENRVANLLRRLNKIPFAFQPFITRHRRHARSFHADLGFGFIAHSPDGVGRGADKGQSGGSHR